MDLPNVQCVISYSAPKHLKTYIHRAGRTARAGEQGLAITMLNKSQISKFKALLDQAEKNNVEEVCIYEFIIGNIFGASDIVHILKSFKMLS